MNTIQHHFYLMELFFSGTIILHIFFMKILSKKVKNCYKGLV